MVAITGNVPRALLGKDAFQETDIVGIALPVTKYATVVMDPDEVPYAVAEAFEIARSGRPGPVLLDFPKDVLQLETSVPYPEPYQLRLPGLLRPIRGDVPEADDLAEMIAAAERPLILSGHGVQIAGAVDLLLQVAERTEIPVAHTLLGIGNMDETHRLSAGYAGMHGWMHVNKMIQQCDLLIGIGCRYDDRITGKMSTFAPNAQDRARRRRPIGDRQERANRPRHRGRRGRPAGRAAASPAAIRAADGVDGPYRRTASYWIMSAKRADTRERRFAELLEVSHAGTRPRAFIVDPARNVQ